MKLINSTIKKTDKTFLVNSVENISKGGIGPQHDNEEYRASRTSQKKN